MYALGRRICSLVTLKSVVKKLASGRTLGVTGATALLALVIGCGGGGGGGGGGTKTTTSTTSTTSTATTSTSTATTAGVLPINTILYAVPNGNGTDYELEGLDPVNAGSSTTIVSDFPASIELFAANPNVKSQYVAAYDPTFGPSDNGLYGIYISTGLTASGIKQLVAPTYIFVSSLSVTDNGKFVVYSATDQTGASNLFVESLSGGTPVNYGLSDGSTVSPADDDTLVYVAIPSSGNTVLDQVLSRSLKAGASGKATQITTDAVNHALPAISRDGTQIAYWEEGTSNNLLVQPISGGSAVTLPNPNALVPQSEAFSGDASSIAIVGLDPNSNGFIMLQTPNGIANPTSLLEVPGTSLGDYGLYWTSQNGRVAGGSVAASSVVRKRMAVGRALRPALHIR